jgi:hypothetical protein
MKKKKAGKKKYNTEVAIAPPVRVQVIDLNGTTYLGELHEDGALRRTMIIEDGPVSDLDLQNYILNGNAGNLENIDVLGSNVLLTVKSLSEVQELTLTSYRATMRLAKRTAIPYLENERFEALVKK